jgi:DNA-binding MurR/RpiR family transcriptional regulator
MLANFSLQETVMKNFDALSPNDRRIAEYVLSNQVSAGLRTIDQLAMEINVSKSAIVRFATRIGYKNFKSLQRELKEHIFQHANMESPLDFFSKTKTLGVFREDIVSRQFRKNMENLRATCDGTQIEEVDKVARRIASRKGRIFIMGQRKSAGLALYCYSLLDPMFDNIYLLESNESFISDTLLSVNKQDLLVALSFKRYGIITLNIAEYFKSVGAEVVLITDNHISPASKWADYTFICVCDGVTIWDSAVSAVSLIEAIISSVVTYSGKVVKDRLKASETLLDKFQVFVGTKKT